MLSTLHELVTVDVMARFLLAVAAVILLSHLLGALLGRLGQPLVVGEILGGLLLGPSVLGWLWPSGQKWLFAPDVTSTLGMAAQLGLIVFMFLLGCELRVDSLRERRSALGGIVVGGMGLPFLTGLGIAAAAPGLLKGSVPQYAAYLCYFGLAMSITALPVLARMLTDMRMDRTPLGQVALAAAAMGDGVAWLALTVILAVTGTGGAGSIAATFGLTVALVAVTAFVVRPLLAAAVRPASRRAGTERLLPMLLVGALAYAVITQVLGLHPVIGAFLFGTAVPRGSAVTERIAQQLQGFTLTILLPLFFAGVGLNVSVRTLGLNPWHWLLFAGVIVGATVAKLVGAGGAARLTGLSASESMRFGTLMNCRGVTELVIAGIGWERHLISTTGLTMLVLMALVTTAMTGPLMRRLGVPVRRDEEPEPDVRTPVEVPARQ
ncbi:cation:proton antiporter [Streptomyces sp. NPDC002004]